MGIQRLYSHQAKALASAREGKNYALVTSTASGKSLCYNLPVLERHLEQPDSTFLYVFPTKALAQDQMRALFQLLDTAGLNLSFGAYDGDTPKAERSRLRRSAKLIVTNPDMLHVGILPYHFNWARFLRCLQFVVIDEAHVYRGVFGSHVANVLRRLRRLCLYYGSDPQFVFASATMANPQEFLEQLAGVPVEVIDEDGSPHGPRYFYLWNPPLLEPELGLRGSFLEEAANIFASLVAEGLRVLAFTRTRRGAELLYLMVQRRLEEVAPHLVARVSSYRAGYLPEERREIEHGMFYGELLGVSSTNALELGIDIGDLDAVILVGYPGSIASLWQMAGRAGRKGQLSATFLVASTDMIDQYFMHSPEDLFARSFEHTLINPENPYILDAHLRCAALELPVEPEADKILFGPSLEDRCEGLARTGELKWNGRWVYSGRDANPARRINIRSSSAFDYLVVDVESGRTLATVDDTRVFSEAHPGAVYLIRGESYVVLELDLLARRVLVRREPVDYYTDPLTLTDVRVSMLHSSTPVGEAELCLGQVVVTEQIVGYRAIRLFSGREVLFERPLDLPARHFPTVAFWVALPLHRALEVVGGSEELAGSLHAAEHASIGLLPLLALCDRRDIGGLSTAIHPDTGCPTIFVYDGVPGGIGISEKGYQLAGELWRRTLIGVERCPCREGCPSCIQSPKCGNKNMPLSKEGAIRLLRFLADLMRGEGAGLPYTVV
jgi:DEAD/DEAH box helicase domain-containing protein